MMKFKSSIVKTKPYDKQDISNKERQKLLDCYIDMINTFFQYNKIEMVRSCLNFLKGKNLLVRYLSTVNYSIVNWAFEHESQIILNELFKPPEKRHQFLIVSHNHYQYIKEFMNRTLQLSFEQFQQQVDSKRYMLTLFLQTKTHLTQSVIQDAMNASSQDERVDKQTLGALQTMINEMMATLDEPTEVENAAQHNSQGVPTFQ